MAEHEILGESVRPTPRRKPTCDETWVNAP